MFWSEQWGSYCGCYLVVHCPSCIALGISAEQMGPAELCEGLPCHLCSSAWELEQLSDGKWRALVQIKKETSVKLFARLLNLELEAQGDLGKLLKNTYWFQ